MSLSRIMVRQVMRRDLLALAKSNRQPSDETLFRHWDVANLLWSHEPRLWRPDIQPDHDMYVKMAHTLWMRLPSTRSIYIVLSGQVDQ